MGNLVSKTGAVNSVNDNHAFDALNRLIQIPPDSWCPVVRLVCYCPPQAVAVTRLR